MSQLFIQQYLNELAKLKKVSGSTRESVLREAFKDLLKAWGKQRDLYFVPEYELDSLTKDKRYVDGALLYELRVPFGYWEAKDSKDDLAEEIAKKFKRGYPKDNIIFEDTQRAVLIQNGQEVVTCPVEDTAALEKLLNLFFGYDRKEIAQFKKAVEQFKSDLPAVLDALRDMIEAAHKENAKFRKESAKFLTHAQEAINPSLTDADVREMLIQHVLTEEIFAKVFPNTQFHKDNNVARELYKLEGTFFTGNTKFQVLKALAPYYSAISAAAAQIERHHEKQSFLKAIYENFYKVYNVKAADRLGVVYTPNEIVRFMIESADWLVQKHFGRALIDKDVEILDPATGTGTFICELLEHFSGQPAKLKHKYLNELHANEVAILPYYVANLNIEATYAAITGEYSEFPNLCFVDTLDNVAGLRKYSGHMDDLFGSVTEENVARIKRQNAKKISVIIGNPPYNANQLNENENNKNREYPDIDKRIKDTYIAESTAQKTKLYDMYARFFRWASDRLDQNGVLAFVTNRSFIESRTFDGFRKTVAKEFNEIYVLDLGGDVRANPKLSGTKHNVFGIQTGVAISLMVKRAKTKGCRVRYVSRPEMETAEDKLAFLTKAKVQDLRLDEITPDDDGIWLNQIDNDFDDHIPLASKETKSATSQSKERAVFKLFTNGVNTARDDWVYGHDEAALKERISYLIRHYNKEYESGRGSKERDPQIKWSEQLLRNVENEAARAFSTKRIVVSNYRPFFKQAYYADPLFSDRLTGNHHSMFGPALTDKNLCIAMTAAGSSKSFSVLATEAPADWHFLGDTQLYSLDRSEGDSITDNITDWGLNQFKKQYGGKVTKLSIFHYVYAVLHDPVYREKYALNLKREFPRIPFYADFSQWADWGKTLIDLHIGYESVMPFKLKRVDKPDEKARKANQAPKAILRADKDVGVITLDSETSLTGVPDSAWDYRLGNRSALEWILDQYKEKKPKDPTIRDKFDTYRFVDYKEQVIDLLMRVSTVSVETMDIVRNMGEAKR